MSRAQKIAAAASVLSFLAVTAGPALGGPVRFSPSVTLEWAALIALIWAAAFAADNLSELRRARVAEILPLIDVRPAWDDASNLQISVRNVGKGAAVGLRGAVWWKDGDSAEWFPYLVPALPDILPAGGTAEGAVDAPLFRLETEEEPIKLVTEIQYEDAEHEHHQQLDAWGFEWHVGPPRLVRQDLRGEAVTNLLAAERGAKDQLLDETLQTVRRAWRLNDHWELYGEVTGNSMSVHLKNPSKEVEWSIGTSADQPIDHQVDAVVERLRREIPFDQWPMVEKQNSAETESAEEHDPMNEVP